ncbi:hypothetical protein NQ176_g3027 [Zarea fungicola]|uniref:Uncharacterized protein n=1 Tax=Zarea fungicola TaxID=93591 RepID=A0ACC1NLH1_9HYPO|nr:hypothetical protein NQ176_g3027 [Lecanicillium fungicola]
MDSLDEVDLPWDKAVRLQLDSLDMVLLQPNADYRAHRASGIQLLNGTEVKGKHVILFSGAVHTPQLRTLSGIGSPEQLAKHGISAQVNAPDAGRNLSGHASSAQPGANSQRIHPSLGRSIKPVSANVKDAPLVDPNYLATAVDKFVARDGMRRLIALIAGRTVLGREILNGEVGSPGFDKPFTAESTDDPTFAAGLGSTYHPMGTATMGKVVDSKLRVIGVAGL